jgi:GNAT superfamily N-acetyltransferase
VPRITVSLASTAGERDEAMAIWEAANAARWRPAGELRAGRVRARIHAADLVLMASYGQHPAGMLLAEPFLDGLRPDAVPDPAAAHVAMVSVEPARWGCGIGTALLRDLQAREWSRLSAWFRDDNRRARRLFAGVGFADTGHRAHLQDGDVIQQWCWPGADAVLPGPS